jgi:protein PET117
MHQGVIRDVDRQRIKEERKLELEEQLRLQKEYEKIQPVSQNGRVKGA